MVPTPDSTSLEFNVPVVQDLVFPFDKDEVKKRWSLDARGGAATWST